MNGLKKAYGTLALAASQLAWSQLQIKAVVNSASYVNYLPGAGGLATIFISGLTGTPGLVTAPTNSPLPTQLAGVQVFIDGLQAPILAVVIPASGSNTLGQINFQVPLLWTVAGQGAYIFVQQEVAATEITTSISPPPAVAGLAAGFFADQNNFGIAQHAADYALVTPENPAHAGETILIYADDFFDVWPPPPIGFPTPPQPLFVAAESYPGNTGYLFLGGKPVQNPGTSKGSCPPPGTPPVNVTFEGLAPGLVGVEQINFVVPSNLQPGTYALYFNTATDSTGYCDAISGSASSSPYVMIPVG